MVFSGPLVRSSYMADRVSEEAKAECLDFRASCQLSVADCHSHATLYRDRYPAASDLPEVRYPLPGSCCTDTPALRAAQTPGRLAEILLWLGGRNLLLVFPLHLDPICPGKTRRYGSARQLGCFRALLFAEGLHLGVFSCLAGAAHALAGAPFRRGRPMDRPGTHSRDLRLCMAGVWVMQESTCRLPLRLAPVRGRLWRLLRACDAECGVRVRSPAISQNAACFRCLQPPSSGCCRRFLKAFELQKRLGSATQYRSCDRSGPRSRN